ncbi:hypothetical protein JKF63_02610 [Porcisia hertigi]|uniref:Uncharacterized protein n=1 Tax=Porcisia hertigi TaxID=2761500 RepID=A0A836I9T8_9TRYP|nr:hypothetical protein JKF63_02610 [Porcisia hertigi]
MWRIRAGGVVAGFVITCAGYYKLFVLPMLDTRAVQEKHYRAIEERLLTAARDAMNAAPAELNAAAASPPSQ